MLNFTKAFLDSVSSVLIVVAEVALVCLVTVETMVLESTVSIVVFPLVSFVDALVLVRQVSLGFFA
jgi:hypothetical protein